MLFCVEIIFAGYTNCILHLHQPSSRGYHGNQWISRQAVEPEGRHTLSLCLQQTCCYSLNLKVSIMFYSWSSRLRLHKSRGRSAHRKKEKITKICRLLFMFKMDFWKLLLRWVNQDTVLGKKTYYYYIKYYFTGCCYHRALHRVNNFWWRGNHNQNCVTFYKRLFLFYQANN